MASVYAAFLQAPNASHLANDASINYITTTTSISEPAAIVKHITAQQKQVTKKEERILSTIEGHEDLLLETETTLQFNNGGGAFLPNMDENLLDEKLVTFPLLHVVQFDATRKIKQIRLYWDQSTLLKQVEAIGKTGRNWPIRDGKAQIEAINKSVKATGGETTGVKSLAARGPNDVVIREHKKSDSVSATRGQSTSLNLFAARDPNEQVGSDYQGPKLAPRASAKPAPRNYNELFANGESPPDDPTSNVRSPSPSKKDGTILKAGAGKHYTGNRLFDDNEPSGARSPERKKVFNQKYDHFAFGDGEDAPSGRPMSNNKSKGAATFSFEDFSTPPKHQIKERRDDQVHWGQEEDQPSPPKRPIVHAARKDADAHFNMTDERSPAAARPPTSKQGMMLYDDPVFGEDTTSQKGSRSNTTSTDNSRRGNDFSAHYQMTDTQSPAQKENAAPSDSMEQHWAFSDSKQEKKIYKTAGDGMGGRSGGHDWMTGEGDQKIYKTAGDGMGGRATTGRSWGIGDESDVEEDTDKRYRGRGRGPQAQAGARQ
ncbi:uncharacterized protein LTR77_001391 [Saxophila tyrrhenica]|uniref:Uncharacterized protein n=1 Tax=Saxophila tyrrhenica TaxID=1690608 RepID=A0AAV9PNE7_9PEZI|nr:hypothetical protein LTR77_001391 [Saxophila tyrrhenica]